MHSEFEKRRETSKHRLFTKVAISRKNFLPGKKVSTASRTPYSETCTDPRPNFFRKTGLFWEQGLALGTPWDQGDTLGGGVMGRRMLGF
jgi:hypothetical protein